MKNKLHHLMFSAKNGGFQNGIKIPDGVTFEEFIFGLDRLDWAIENGLVSCKKNGNGEKMYRVNDRDWWNKAANAMPDRQDF